MQKRIMAVEHLAQLDRVLAKARELDNSDVMSWTLTGLASQEELDEWRHATAAKSYIFRKVQLAEDQVPRPDILDQDWHLAIFRVAGYHHRLHQYYCMATWELPEDYIKECANGLYKGGLEARE